MKNQKYLQKFYMVLIVCYFMSILLCNCTSENSVKNIDVSNIKLNYQSIRFDHAFFNIDTNDLENGINRLSNQYPEFASIYFNEITGFAKAPDQQTFLNAVRHFLTYKDYRGLHDTVSKHFVSIKQIDAQLEDLFKHIRYYYPNQHWSKVYYFTSGLNNWSAITIDTCVGVGLDMYLGKSYPFYQSVQMPQYQVEKCEPEYIPVNVCKAIYEDMQAFNAEGKTLLDLFIMRGKEVLFTEYNLPKQNMDVLLGYTPKQLKWCEENEGLIWNYFTKSKLIYSTQWQDILRYVNDGPNTTGMPPESPGNIGSWIGWKIVKQYLDHTPTEKWTDFIRSGKSSQKILKEADYRPR